jgi:hypothetical protein
MNSVGTRSVSQTWLGVKKKTCPAPRMAWAATHKTTAGPRRAPDRPGCRFIRRQMNMVAVHPE